MRKFIKVEIKTDASGEFCTVYCPHFAGGCDAFGGERLKRVQGAYALYYRTEHCKANEIKAPGENYPPNAK